MPTTFLGLTTNTQASGSATTFLTWRLAQNDETNSNATKIDTYAQNMSASVVTLQGQVSYLVNATESTTNNYVATVTGFTSYTDGKLINLILDVKTTGTTTLNINSLGTKTLYKMLSNGTAGNLTSGDLAAGRPQFFMYNISGGYWLWVNGTSADQINISGNVNEIAILSGSGLASSGISASSISPVDGYYVTTQLGTGLTNEAVISAGSGIGIVNDLSASKLYVKNNIIAGNNITLSADASSSAVTITGAVAASSVAPITASYLLFGSLDSTLTNDKILSAGSGISSSNDVAASTVYLNINALAPLSASATQIKHNTSGVTAGTYILSSTTVDSTGHITSASSGVIADAAQTSSGSSATALVSASGLAHSNYGTKTGEIVLNTSTALTGAEKNYIRIPSYMNGWKVIDAAASCGAPDGSGSSTSGSPTFFLKRSSASSMTQVSLLNNVIMIDQGEFDSSTSGSPVSISAVNTVYTGDKVWGSTSASGTGVTYVTISPTFQNLP